MLSRWELHRESTSTDKTQQIQRQYHQINDFICPPNLPHRRAGRSYRQFVSPHHQLLTDGLIAKTGKKEQGYRKDWEWAQAIARLCGRNVLFSPLPQTISAAQYRKARAWVYIGRIGDRNKLSPSPAGAMFCSPHRRRRPPSAAQHHRQGATMPNWG